MKADWVIVGSGVQGRDIGAVVLAVVAATGERLLGFLDDDPSLQGKTVADLPVLGPLEWARSHGAPLKVAVGLGQSGPKRKVVARLRTMGDHLTFPPVIHPFSSVGPRVELGEGVVVKPGVVVSCDVKVGEFSVLGTSSTLGHDSRVGAYNFLAAGSRLAGYATIQDDCVTGLNTCIIANRTMRNGSISGAGAVIIHDVHEGDTVVGVPARSAHRREGSDTTKV